MVIGVVAREAFKFGAKAFTRYYRAEGKAFDKLYSGFPRARTIGRGVRHGLTAGSVAGSFINAPDTPGNDYAQIPAIPRKQFTARKPYKTRRRPTARTCAKCRTNFQPYRNSRFSSTSRYR